MPGGANLADLVLRDDNEDDDPEIKALEAELAALKKKSASSSRPPTAPRPSDDAPRPKGGYAADSVPVSEEPQAKATPSAASRAKAASIAEKILEKSTAADDAEAEFARMEADLQKQLKEFQKNTSDDCTVEKDAGAPSSTEALPEPAPAAASEAPVEEVASRPVSKLGSRQSSRSGKGVRGPPELDAVGQGDKDGVDGSGEGAEALMSPSMEAAQELARLRIEAQMMEAAFPDADADPTPREPGTEAAAPAEPQDWLGTAAIAAAENAHKRGKIPPKEDPELVEMRRTLGDLDNRLGAIKKRQELRSKDEREKHKMIMSQQGSSTDAIRKLKAQNDHLRAKFGFDTSSGKYGAPKGLANIDSSIFKQAK